MLTAIPRLDVWRLNDLLVAINDAPTGQVVGRQLHDDAILGQDTDVVLAHLAGNVSQYLVAIVQFDTEHRVRQGLDNATLNLDGAFLLCHILQRFPSSDSWMGDVLLHVAHIWTFPLLAFSTFYRSPAETKASCTTC